MDNSYTHKKENISLFYYTFSGMKEAAEAYIQNILNNISHFRNKLNYN